MSERNSSEIASYTLVDQLETKGNIGITKVFESHFSKDIGNECIAKNVFVKQSVNDSVDTVVTETSSDKNENPVTATAFGKAANDAVIIVDRALCADYRSDFESDSFDSESDSSTSSSISSSDSEDDSSSFKKIKNRNSESCSSFKSDFFSTDLPSIQDLKISLPEQSCVEVGVISSVVDTLVVVESHKGTPALDVDTILFLDHGKRPLGRVFEILGPISEPVYVVRFNSSGEIISNTIVKGLKVYYGPQTQHTKFVFLSEVMKCRGSDASWKDNIEAPSEFQDFSDDEEENLFKKKIEKLSRSKTSDENNSKKRALNHQLDVVQPCKLKNNNFSRKNLCNNTSFAQRERFRSGHPRSSFAPMQTSPNQAFAFPPHAYFYPRYINSINYFPQSSYPYVPPPSPRFSFFSYENSQFSHIPQGVQPEFLFQRTQLLPENLDMRWRIISSPPPPPPPPPPTLPSAFAPLQDNKEASPK